MALDRFERWVIYFRSDIIVIFSARFWCDFGEYWRNVYIPPLQLSGPMSAVLSINGKLRQVHQAYNLENQSRNFSRWRPGRTSQRMRPLLRRGKSNMKLFTSHFSTSTTKNRPPHSPNRILPRDTLKLCQSTLIPAWPYRVRCNHILFSCKNSTLRSGFAVTS